MPKKSTPGEAQAPDPEQLRESASKTLAGLKQRIEDTRTGKAVPEGGFSSMELPYAEYFAQILNIGERFGWGSAEIARYAKSRSVADQGNQNFYDDVQSFFEEGNFVSAIGNPDIEGIIAGMQETAIRRQYVKGDRSMFGAHEKYHYGELPKDFLDLKQLDPSLRTLLDGDPPTYSEEPRKAMAIFLGASDAVARARAGARDVKPSKNQSKKESRQNADRMYDVSYHSLVARFAIHNLKSELLKELIQRATPLNKEDFALALNGEFLKLDQQLRAKVELDAAKEKYKDTGWDKVVKFFKNDWDKTGRTYKVLGASVAAGALTAAILPALSPAAAAMAVQLGSNFLFYRVARGVVAGTIIRGVISEGHFAGKWLSKTDKALTGAIGNFFKPFVQEIQEGSIKEKMAGVSPEEWSLRLSELQEEKAAKEAEKFILLRWGGKLAKSLASNPLRLLTSIALGGGIAALSD
ncbi:MAG: hypothetical protein Q8P56_03255, partial [Candidatus Uhrbacteria bacterium]|nr:hypothetical protein [Candidatus Uhrbacteria bacterium]